MATMEANILVNAVNSRVQALALSHVNEVHVARLKREICAAVASNVVSMQEALEYLKDWVPANGLNGRSAYK